MDPDNAAIEVLQYSTTTALFRSAASLYATGSGFESFDFAADILLFYSFSNFSIKVKILLKNKFPILLTNRKRFLSFHLCQQHDLTFDTDSVRDEETEIDIKAIENFNFNFIFIDIYNGIIFQS